MSVELTDAVFPLPIFGQGELTETTMAIRIDERQVMNMSLEQCVGYATKYKVFLNVALVAYSFVV